MIGAGLRERLARNARRRGNRARDARAWREAAKAYRRYLAVHPEDAAIQVQLAHMLSEAGAWDEADHAYATAARLTPDDVDLHRCWARSRRAAGDDTRAEELHRQSLALAGEDDGADTPQTSERASEEPSVEPSPPPEETRPPVRLRPRPDIRPLATSAWFHGIKRFRMRPGSEVAVFVTHSRTGALKPHVPAYLRALRAEGVDVLLIAVADRQLSIADEVLDIVAGAAVRDNVGYDFGAWAHALKLYPELFGASILYLVNDSMLGPPTGDAFARMIARVRASEADLVGLTESHEHRWHVQSYFLALKPRLLSSFALQDFFAQVRALDDKDAVIRAYEMALAPMVERSGHRIELLFPCPLALNPTLYGWRDLIDRGFPFVKVLLLRGTFAETDLHGWREALAEAGFDLNLVDALLATEREIVPEDPGLPIYAHPPQLEPVGDRPIDIAFYGPWNYDNGLGAASRGIIGALRRSGARLNLHPIKRPFHVHRPLAPPVDVIEFGGTPDVAIAHLNPDSWFLLTPEQRRAIGQATRRIGYWVWEMGHVPDAWWQDFGSVDRIWAPSDYCARLFEAQDGAPVDIIPHVVPLPSPASIDRAGVLGGLGIAPERRVILFAFDGSSYLIRKNPAALIRAFAASGLAARGWTLLLKTKHLMDRVEEGAALRALADATSDVALIDRTMSEEELGALLQAADIYASPHCSEGFGLTIAEAMAAGKSVVATDFGGSRDFLDASRGYPVTAHPWRLEEDFGHYTSGGEWARIDEAALADALLAAAEAIETGDDARGQKARAWVAGHLSLDAIGTAIDRSMRRTLAAPPASAPVRPIVPRLGTGTPIEGAEIGTGFHAIVLATDGSADDARLPDAAEDGDWLVLAPTRSVLAPDFAGLVRDHADARPDVAIFYGDDLAGETDRAIDQLRLKPDFDPTLLAAQDYIGAPLIVRADTLRSLGGLNPDRGTAATADLVFRAHARGLSIARIPHVLLARVGRRVRPQAADYRAVLEAQPALAAYDIVPGRTPDTFALDRRFTPDTMPDVTIVIPTRRTPLPDGSRSYVAGLLDRLAETDWPMARLHVIVGDDIAGEPDWAATPHPYTLRRVETPRAPDEPFNYAAKMNRLWREATTEQVVFLNDDVLPIDGGWLHALQTFAVDRSVGGVGARLLFEDGRLQHAGMAPHGTGTAHLWLGRTRAEGTYQDWALTQREWSMVTGAVFATRRSLLEQLNGFEEGFALEFNDTDLCLRLRMLGYRIVYTPRAEMVHVEKASRGETLPSGHDVARFLARWSDWLANDPSWHPGLDSSRLDMAPRLDPDAWYSVSAAGLRDKGMALDRLGRREEAQAAYRQAIELDPGSLDFYVELVRSLLQAGHAEEAEAIAMQAAAISPDDPGAWATLAEARIHGGKPDEAAEATREALRLSPRRIQTHRLLGMAYSATGDLAGAERHARQAVRLEPRAPDHRNLLAETLEGLGRRDEALAVLEEGLAIGGFNDQTFSLLGNFWQREGKLDRAEQAFGRGAELYGKQRPDLVDCLTAIRERRQNEG